jgi:hypothetical protein
MESPLTLVPFQEYLHLVLTPSSLNMQERNSAVTLVCQTHQEALEIGGDSEVTEEASSSTAGE